MALEMRTQCERCGAETGPAGEAYVCSYECTFCGSCKRAMQAACPNYGDELVMRPRRLNLACGCGKYVQVDRDEG